MEAFINAVEESKAAFDREMRAAAVGASGVPTPRRPLPDRSPPQPPGELAPRRSSPPRHLRPGLTQLSSRSHTASPPQWELYTPLVPAPGSRGASPSSLGRWAGEGPAGRGFPPSGPSPPRSPSERRRRIVVPDRPPPPAEVAVYRAEGSSAAPDAESSGLAALPSPPTTPGVAASARDVLWAVPPVQIRTPAADATPISPPPPRTPAPDRHAPPPPAHAADDWLSVVNLSQSPIAATDDGGVFAAQGTDTTIDEQEPPPAPGRAKELDGLVLAVAELAAQQQAMATHQAAMTERIAQLVEDRVAPREGGTDVSRMSSSREASLLTASTSGSAGPREGRGRGCVHARAPPQSEGVLGFSAAGFDSVASVGTAPSAVGGTKTQARVTRTPPRPPSPPRDSSPRGCVSGGTETPRCDVSGDERRDQSAGDAYHMLDAMHRSGTTPRSSAKKAAPSSPGTVSGPRGDDHDLWLAQRWPEREQSGRSSQRETGARMQALRKTARTPKAKTRTRSPPSRSGDRKSTAEASRLNETATPSGEMPPPALFDGAVDGSLVYSSPGSESYGKHSLRMLAEEVSKDRHLLRATVQQLGTLVDAHRITLAKEDPGPPADAPAAPIAALDAIERHAWRTLAERKTRSLVASASAPSESALRDDLRRRFEGMPVRPGQ
eukprot:TRINITY_DN4675_c0_g2_i1.p1 TRINITY_DN4675_c0_g2~~TRINITY_DN4675_c0_g2_i1.p1  ORF type:complete len:665 (+),score=123.15 TRINITY_DN4675_c0_g2_i1:52-2046(+)